MRSVTFVATTAILASSLVSARDTTVLGPVLAPHVDRSSLTNVAPSHNIALHYGDATNSAAISSVNVSMEMSYPSVKLEDIASVSSVICTDTSVAVTFDSADAFSLAKSSWTADGTFVIVTNHLGNCDAAQERGIFLAKSVSANAAGLTVTASGAKSNIENTASMVEVNFSGLNTTATPVDKRYITLDPSATFSADYSLAADTVIYSYAPYLTVTADEASVSASVTLSGYLKYAVLTFTVVDLYFDVDVAADAELEISVDVDASYSNTFTYSPSELSYSLVDIPGILSLGPAVALTLSAEIVASAAVDLTAGVSVTLPAASVHVDLLDEANTATSGWTPTYSAYASVSGVLAAQVNPSIGLTVELAVNFLSGLLDLSSGITATPGLINTFTLSGSADVVTSGTTATTATGTCADGILLTSEFVFNLVAFVTEFYSVNLYSYTNEFLDKCYTL